MILIANDMLDLMHGLDEWCWVLSLHFSARATMVGRCDSLNHQVRNTKPRRCLQKGGLKHAFGVGTAVDKIVDLASQRFQSRA